MRENIGFGHSPFRDQNAMQDTRPPCRQNCKRRRTNIGFVLLIVAMQVGLLSPSRSSGQNTNWDGHYSLPNLGGVYALATTENGDLYVGGNWSWN